jgi:hypothetical protein
MPQKILATGLLFIFSMFALDSAVAQFFHKDILSADNMAGIILAKDTKKEKKTTKTATLPTKSVLLQNSNYVMSDLVARYNFEDGFKDIVSGTSMVATGSVPIQTVFGFNKVGSIENTSQLIGKNGLITSSVNISSTTFTFSIWFKKSLRGADGMVAQLFGGTNILYFDGDLLMYQIANSDPNEDAFSQNDIGVIGDSEWHSVIITSDSQNIRTYLDGRFIRTTSTNNFKMSNTIAIGMDINSPREWFTGLVDDINIYSRVLNDFEISQLYSSELLHFREPVLPGGTAWVKNVGTTNSDYINSGVVSGSNIYIGGSSGSALYVQKLDSSGVPVLGQSWPKLSSNAGGAKAIMSDSQGNIIVGGYFYNSIDLGSGIEKVATGGIADADAFLVKYNSNGQHIWSKTFGSANGSAFLGDETVSSISIDAQGDILVTGGFHGGSMTIDGITIYPYDSNGRDVFVAKFSAGGSLLWLKAFTASGSDDIGNSITSDSSTNVYITGKFSGNMNIGSTTLNGLASDIFVVKLSSSGNFIWSTKFGTNGLDSGNAVSVSNEGLYVTGMFNPRITIGSTVINGQGSDDIFVAKLNKDNGSVVWAKGYGSANADVGSSIAVDSANNVYVVGRSGQNTDFGGGPSGSCCKNAFVLKLNSSGSYIWNKTAGSGREEANVVYINNNTPIVFGKFSFTVNFGGTSITNTGNNSNPDIFIWKLNP